MRDSVDDLEMDLGRLPEVKKPASPSPAQQVRRALRGKHVCPFCGTTRELEQSPCPQCSLEDSPTTRSATRGKLGPWYVLQSRNPSAPGMNFATLMTLVQKGRVTAQSVLRGPTTGQFWKHAAKVKGVSREFGLCWNCGGDVARNARACPNCKRLQEPPVNPDILLEKMELTADEVTEHMWADEDRSPAPAAHSPVDRLAARGGVRREIPETAIGNGALPQPPRRGHLTDTAQPLPPAHDEDINPTHAPGIEMAVFQIPRGQDYRRRSFAGKLFKVLFVAILIMGAGLALMCYFDTGVRAKVLSYYEKAKTQLGLGDDKGGSSRFIVDPQPGR